MFTSLPRFRSIAVLTCFFVLISCLPALALLDDLLGKKQPNEEERKQTIENIENIQNKLKLLQEKLRVLERRKAAKAAAQRAASIDGTFPAVPLQVNWIPVDETTTEPGEFGIYTYLLFQGEMTDTTAAGALEDFILTLETLPENDIPPGLANRFLVPVEKPQSTVNLGRQPYDFELNQAYLRRFALQKDLPNGPILVSTLEPIDPYSEGEITAFFAVSLGRQTPQKNLELAKLWHEQEKSAIAATGHPVADLFWQLIDGAGSTMVTRDQQRLLIELPQQ